MDCIDSNFLNTTPYKGCYYVIYPPTYPEAESEPTKTSPAKSSLVWLKIKIKNKNINIYIKKKGAPENRTNRFAQSTGQLCHIACFAQSTGQLCHIACFE